jgi:hypothetical protein
MQDIDDGHGFTALGPPEAFAAAVTGLSRNLSPRLINLVYDFRPIRHTVRPNSRSITGRHGTGLNSWEWGSRPTINGLAIGPCPLRFGSDRLLHGIN